MKTWSNRVKEEVRELRNEGASFGEIIRKYGVARSTLHYWLRDMSRPKDLVTRSRAMWAKEIQPLGALANKKKREERLEKMIARVECEVRGYIYPMSTKKALLAMLYWAEGSKTRNDVINFANTDPKMIKLFIGLLRECFDIKEDRFRIRLHLHYYHNEMEVKNFWSSLTGVPIEQFTKVYWKKRLNKKVRKNSQGICFLKYNSLVLKEEIIAFAHAVASNLE